MLQKSMSFRQAYWIKIKWWLVVWVTHVSYSLFWDVNHISLYFFILMEENNKFVSIYLYSPNEFYNGSRLCCNSCNIPLFLSFYNLTIGSKGKNSKSKSNGRVYLFWFFSLQSLLFFEMPGKNIIIIILFIRLVVKWYE